MLLNFSSFPLLIFFALIDFSNEEIMGGTRAGFTDAGQKHGHNRDVGLSKSHSLEFNGGQKGQRGLSQQGSNIPIKLFGHILERGHPAGRVYYRGLQTGSKPNRAKNSQGFWSNRSDQGFGGSRIRRVRDVISRMRRLASTIRPDGTRFGGLNLAQGLTYTWTRDFSAGKSFDEAAFKSLDKNVIVVMSFDNTLKDSNLTASSTVYDFTGTSGIMAIKPRLRAGPCFLVETSMTYDRIISELDTRNGSSVSTSTVILLDGTGNPVSLSERLAIIKKTPSLARQCRGRKIIRTRPIGVSPNTPEVQTKELKVLTMDAELSIIVPVDPDLNLEPTRRWFSGQVKGENRLKGLGFWKGQ